MSTEASKRSRQALPSSAVPLQSSTGGGGGGGVATAAAAGATETGSRGGGGCCGKSSSRGRTDGCCNRCLERCAVCTATLTRVCLIIPNLVFLLFGGTLIGLGVWMRADRESSFYLEILRNLPASPLITFDKVPIVIIIVGSCVAILSFLGCCGACAESVCFLCLYMLLLVIVLITEVVLGIVVVAMRNQILLRLETSMQHQIKFEYNATEPQPTADNRTYVRHFTEAWDSMQIQFRCCGAFGPEDFKDSAWYNRTKKSTEKSKVPLSCCYQPTDHIPKYNSALLSVQDKKRSDCQQDASKLFQDPILWRKKETSTALKTQGCREAMEDLLQRNLTIVIGVGSSVALFQVANFVFACVLMRLVRKKQEHWYDDENDYANDDCAD